MEEHDDMDDLVADLLEISMRDESDDDDVLEDLDEDEVIAYA